MTAARLTLAGLAAMWCGDERFQRWLGVTGSAAARRSAPRAAVIITDGNDYTTFEWKHGEGIVFPPQTT